MRTSSAAVLVAIALGACGPASVPFEISFHLQQESSYRCSSDSCANVPMACDAAVLVRIADPDDPTAAYISECFHVLTDGSLCSLANIQLPQEMIPNEMVLVQVVVWSWDQLSLDQQQSLDCPQGVSFDLANVPHAAPTPALGGQAFFQVGSSPSADVTIQCMNIEALNTDECEGFQGHITTRVLDMSLNLIDVGPVKVDDVDVFAVGPTVEPGTGDWFIDPDEPDDEIEMVGTDIVPTPHWEADLARPMANALCIQVFDHTEGGAAVTVHCVEPDDDAPFKEGVLVPKTILDKVIAAVGEFPAVLGVVLDAGGAPAAGVTITADNGTVRYLNDTLTSTEDGLGAPLTATTSSGAFVSMDATLGVPGALNIWHATIGTNNEQEPGIGGRVEGKLTFVKLQLKP